MGGKKLYLSGTKEVSRELKYRRRRRTGGHRIQVRKSGERAGEKMYAKISIVQLPEMGNKNSSTVCGSHTNSFAVNGGEVASDVRSVRPRPRASGSDDEREVSVANGAVHPALPF